MYEFVAKKLGTLTATGGADGYVAITSNVGFYPGTFGYLYKADGSAQQYVMITDTKSTDKIGLRFIAESASDDRVRLLTVRPGNAGRSSCTGFTTGDKVSFGAQIAPVQQPTFVAQPSVP
jgi:hypothetical protein